MDSSKFDTRIKELKEQVNVLRGRMEEACKEFLDATKQFAVGWFQDCVESTVVSNYERAKEYGVKGLRNLKSDLGKLITIVPSIVEKHVNNDKYWVHRGVMSYDVLIQNFRYLVYQGHFPDTLGNAVREVLGYVGAIIVKHGFVNTGQAGTWEVKHGAAQPIYRRRYIWSEKMNNALKQYSNLCNEARKLSMELKEEEREKAEAEAKDLWKQA